MTKIDENGYEVTEFVNMDGVDLHPKDVNWNHVIPCGIDHYMTCGKGVQSNPLEFLSKGELKEMSYLLEFMQEIIKDELVARKEGVPLSSVENGELNKY
jgi:hypothetical protein